MMRLLDGMVMDFVEWKTESSPPRPLRYVTDTMEVPFIARTRSLSNTEVPFQYQFQHFFMWVTLVQYVYLHPFIHDESSAHDITSSTCQRTCRSRRRTKEPPQQQGQEDPWDEDEKKGMVFACCSNNEM